MSWSDAKSLNVSCRMPGRMFSVCSEGDVGSILVFRSIVLKIWLVSLALLIVVVSTGADVGAGAVAGMFLCLCW